MNWTEGNLNRHSRARKGKQTVLRQKEHFAKVRARPLGANAKSSPLSISVLAVPSRPPSSIRRADLKSTSSSNQSGGRLISSHYFSGAHPKLPAPTHLPDDDAEEVMRQKRRKLLLKGDWVGTNVQKPIEMEFTKPGGSSSNPWGAKKKSRHPASKHKLRQLVGLAHLKGHKRSHPRPVNTCTPTSARQIKVRVGAHERALGDGSNASSRSRGLQVGISDSLGQPMFHPRRDHHQDHGRLSATLSDSNHQSHSSAGQTPLLTTSPLLFHPVPTRPALLQLLHRQSADSDKEDSTFAQVGAESPAFPPSQAEENDVWRNFVVGSDENSASNEMQPSDVKDAAQRLISPGISQLGPSRQLYDTCDATATASPVIAGVDDIGEETSNAPTVLCMTAGGSDEVSLLAISSSPKLLPSLDRVVDDTTSETDQPGDIGSVEKEVPSESKQEDENDMWRKFVFGESSENLREALEEARGEIARLSLPSTGNCPCEESQKGPIEPSLGSESIGGRDSPGELCKPTTASASHVATAGTSSSAELSSEATSESMNTAVRTDRATQGSSGSSSANDNDTGRLLFPNALVTHAIREADTGLFISNPERLEKHEEADDCFKFAKPKLFVGKKIGHVDEQRQIALSAPQIRGTTRTRRRQRGATDGRANIRRLPNYGSDPIEEFEGDVRSDKAEKGSMFGPLETENEV